MPNWACAIRGAPARRGPLSKLTLSFAGSAHSTVPATVKQHLAAIRMLFDWLVTGQVVATQPRHPFASSRAREGCSIAARDPAVSHHKDAGRPFWLCPGLRGLQGPCRSGIPVRGASRDADAPRDAAEGHPTAGCSRVQAMEWR
jgi:hypothetical protein